PATCRPRPVNAPGPIITTTPISPQPSPTTRPRVSLSSLVVAFAMTTANSGVVALRMEASPLAICV
ncbi:MAG TPA: hypothetical protein VFY53_03435, partial [Rhodoplanes sp.]|nr:hypothetical protein [Rhodoplanes sp.]